MEVIEEPNIIGSLMQQCRRLPQGWKNDDIFDVIGFRDPSYVSITGYCRLYEPVMYKFNPIIRIYFNSFVRPEHIYSEVNNHLSRATEGRKYASGDSFLFMLIENVLILLPERQYMSVYVKLHHLTDQTNLSGLTDLIASRFNTIQQSVESQMSGLRADIERLKSQLVVKRELKDSDPECIGCSSKIPKFACVPCGHVPFCEDCVKKYNQDTCPMCRRHLDRFMELYLY